MNGQHLARTRVASIERHVSARAARPKLQVESLAYRHDRDITRNRPTRWPEPHEGF